VPHVHRLTQHGAGIVDPAGRQCSATLCGEVVEDREIQLAGFDAEDVSRRLIGDAAGIETVVAKGTA
jgi:hypothetical protein